MHHQNTPQVNNDHERLMVLLESVVIDTLYARHKERKNALAEQFEAGEKHDVKNAQGLKLGTVSKSSPNKKAVPTDESILIGAAAERGMELIDHLPREGTEEYVKAIDVLAEHAPELLPTPTVSKADVEEIAKGVLEQWQITGVEPIGWEIRDASAPRFSVTKPRGNGAKTAKAAIAHIVGEVENILALEAPKKEEDK